MNMEQLDRRRQLRRCVGPFFVGLGLVLSTLVAGPTVDASSRDPLKALNIIEVTGTASISVSLASDATIRTPFGASADVSVRGGKGFVGFALVREGSAQPLVIFGGRLPTSDGRTFAMPISNGPDRTGFNMERVKNYRDEVPLPAGAYRLFVLTEGGKATLRLRLGGLRGKARLRPNGPADYDITRPEARVFLAIALSYAG